MASERSASRSSISTDEISITFEFRGTDLTIFGAIGGFDADLLAQGQVQHHRHARRAEGQCDNAQEAARLRSNGPTKNWAADRHCHRRSFGATVGVHNCTAGLVGPAVQLQDLRSTLRQAQARKLRHFPLPAQRMLLPVDAPFSLRAHREGHAIAKRKARPSPAGTVQP